jgi:hypothetical protein
LVGRKFFELDILASAAPEHGFPTCCPYILNPLDVLTEHRHEVPLSIDNSQDHWQRDGPP